MPMEYADFYDIATYGNEAWKGSFSPKEIAQNAYDYLCEFRVSKANEVITHTIKELARLLVEDVKAMPDLIEPKEWLYRMASELGLIDMDCHDYEDTDEWLKAFL